MKIRWHQHEIILVSALVLIAISRYLISAYYLTPEQIETNYAAPFSRANVPFNYYVNILLPQIGQFLLLYSAYILVNRLIVPLLRKISLSDTSIIFFKKAGIILLQLTLISYLLALGANALTYYAHPYYFNYGGAGFQVLALFGYNDKPLTDLFAGLSHALGLTGAYVMYTGIGEIIIYYLQSPGSNRLYRILITNQVTAFLAVYLSMPIFLSTFDLVNSYFIKGYFGFVPPILLVFIINIYWLFPLKGDSSFLSLKMIWRLVLANFVSTIPFLFFLARIKEDPRVFLVGWAIQLFIVTPLSWLFYQQRKDKILELRGVEKALIKSTTDLQFLRSQINPHFLFNTLNTLYGTALKEGSEHTAEGIQKLGDMMRFMLHENNLDFIPLSREIEYLKNYISLQKLRILTSTEISIEDDIGGNHFDYKIAPMLLIPFVENAFKHGVSLTERSWIKINLDCDANTIHFEVRNSVHPAQKNISEVERSGIGLKNVIERLKLIYGKRHQFCCRENNTEFIVKLSIKP